MLENESEYWKWIESYREVEKKEGLYLVDPSVDSENIDPKQTEDSEEFYKLMLSASKTALQIRLEDYGLNEKDII